MIKGYKFNQLPQQAQNRVINDKVEFWIACKEYDVTNKGNFEVAIDKAQTLGKKFLKIYVGMYCINEIIEDIKLENQTYNYYGDIIEDRQII